MLHTTHGNDFELSLPGTYQDCCETTRLAPVDFLNVEYVVITVVLPAVTDQPQQLGGLTRVHRLFTR